MLNQQEIIQIIKESKRDESPAASKYSVESNREYNRIADTVIHEIENGRFNSWGNRYTGWVEESFYFGSQGYPDSANWRRNGLRLQVRAERYIKAYEYSGEITDPVVIAEVELFPF